LGPLLLISVDSKPINTVKPVLFACPLFHDLSNIAKIMGCEHSKSHATFYVLPASKNAKIKGIKMM